MVSVLFADLAGFTTLSERMDPEQVKILVDRCFEALATDVTDFGGKVDKIIGDAISALYGAPIAHEDDAERAVRSGLAMQATTERLSAETGISVRLRVGINTGEVLVGGLRTGGDYTAMGDVVNAAQRLQTSARPGQVLVGPDTHDATNQVIAYQSVGELKTKGREEPIKAWLALEALTQPGRRPRRRQTPLFGRDQEIHILKAALDLALEGQTPSLLTLIGEAGAGKSRLVEELTSYAASAHGAAWFEGRCIPYGESNPWWPVASILDQAFGIQTEDSVQIAEQKVRVGVALSAGIPADSPDAVVLSEPLISVMGIRELMSEVDPERRKQDVIRSLAELIENLAKRRPLMIVLSELHWADDLVLEAVNLVVGRIGAVPLAMIITARPELTGRWTPDAGSLNSSLVHLKPLNTEASRELVESVLDSNADPGLVSLITDRGGGNPLFLEELALLLGDPTTSSTGLPATLRGLISGKLDSLAPPARSVVADAAVVGQVGSTDAVVALAAKRGEPNAQEVLKDLANENLLELTDDHVRFKSDLLREVAYETLSKAERARRHSLLGDWIEELSGEKQRTEEQSQDLALNWGTAAVIARELGGVPGVGADIERKALSALESAAARAESRDTFSTALRMLDMIATLAPEEVSAQVSLRRATALAGLRQLDLASRLVEPLLKDSSFRAHALLVRGDIESKSGELAKAVRTLSESAELFDKIGNAAMQAEALRLQGRAEVLRGDLEAAEPPVSAALKIFRSLKQKRGIAWGLQQMAWIAFYRGDMNTAREWLTESGSVFAEIADWRGFSWVLGLLGWVRLSEGRLDEAGELAAQVLPEARRSKDAWAIGIMLVLLSSVRLWTGKTTAALETAREALGVFEAAGEKWGRLHALSLIVRAQTLLGETIQAGDRLSELKKLSRDADPGLLRHLGSWIEMWFHSQTGELRSPPRGSGPGSQLSGDEWLTGQALMSCQAGKFDEALEILESTASEGADGRVARLNSLKALALAGEGRYQESLDASAQVGSLEGGTYVDRSAALIASAFTHRRLGNWTAAEDAISGALEVLTTTEDILNTTLAHLAHGYLLGDINDSESQLMLGHARSELERIGVSAHGWERLYRKLAGL